MVAPSVGGFGVCVLGAGAAASAERGELAGSVRECRVVEFVDEAVRIVASAHPL
jgi:hypothetical protein